jgi:hypothetical protein
VGILRIFDQNKNLLAVFPSHVENFLPNTENDSIFNYQKMSRSFLENQLTMWIESLLEKSESDKLTDLYCGFIDYDYFIFSLNFENLDSFPSTPIRPSISLLEDVFRKWEPSSLTEIYTFEIITADIFLTMLSKNRMMAFFNSFPENTPGISPRITTLSTLKKGDILKKPTECKILFSQNKTRIRREFEVLAQQRSHARKNWLKEFSLICKNYTSQVLLLPKKVNPSIQKILPIPYWTPQVGLFFICWIQIDLLQEIFKNYSNQNIWFKAKRKELLGKYEQFEVDTQIATLVRQHLQQHIDP